jgi:hypothetical protein
MLKAEVEALLKVEFGDDFELKLNPVRLSKSQLTRPGKFDWNCSRAFYWVGYLDTRYGQITTGHYHTTNHKAASELYKVHLLWKS